MWQTMQTGDQRGSGHRPRWSGFTSYIPHSPSWGSHGDMRAAAACQGEGENQSCTFQNSLFFKENV